MKKILSLLSFIVLFFSGCYEKHYSEPYLKLTFLDKESQKSIPDVKVQKGTYEPEIFYSDGSGVVEFEGKYTEHLREQSVQMPYHGQLEPEVLEYFISHPEYNDYVFTCKFKYNWTTKECFPKEFKKTSTDKKELLLKWDNLNIKETK